MLDLFEQFEASFLVMPGFDPDIHAVTSQRVEAPMEWIAGSSPAMTSLGWEAGT
jgi:hypothetical protein